MSRQDANAAFAQTSFLYGGNAAYIEDLQAQFEKNPNAIDAEWRAFFQSLKDNSADVAKNASGPSWQRPNIPHADGELIAALTGDWSAVEKTVGDKIKSKAQARGAEISAADERGGTRSALLRLHRRRHGSQDLPRQGSRPRVRVGARDGGDPAPDLLPDARRRIPAHLRSGAEVLAS